MKCRCCASDAHYSLINQGDYGNHGMDDIEVDCCQEHLEDAVRILFDETNGAGFNEIYDLKEERHLSPFSEVRAYAQQVENSFAKKGEQLSFNFTPCPLLLYQKQLRYGHWGLQ